MNTNFTASQLSTAISTFQELTTKAKAQKKSQPRICLTCLQVNTPCTCNTTLYTYKEISTHLNDLLSQASQPQPEPQPEPAQVQADQADITPTTEVEEETDSKHYTKYQYPADCITPAQKKAYRKAARKAARKASTTTTEQTDQPQA